MTAPRVAMALPASVAVSSKAPLTAYARGARCARLDANASATRACWLGEALAQKAKRTYFILAPAPAGAGAVAAPAGAGAVAAPALQLDGPTRPLACMKEVTMSLLSSEDSSPQPSQRWHLRHWLHTMPA